MRRTYGGRADTWILADGVARQLVEFRTPAGRTYWRTASSMRPEVCPPEVDETARPAAPTPTIDPADRRIEVSLEQFRRAWNDAEPSLVIDAFEIAETRIDNFFHHEFYFGLGVHGQVWPDQTLKSVFVDGEPGIIGTYEVDETELAQMKRAMAALIRAAAPAMSDAEVRSVLDELGVPTLAAGEATRRTVRTHDLAIFLFGNGLPDWTLRIQDADDPES